jgi:hypothetical protein
LVIHTEKKILTLEEDNRLLKIQILSAPSPQMCSSQHQHCCCNSSLKSDNISSLLLPSISTLGSAINQLTTAISSATTISLSTNATPHKVEKHSKPPTYKHDKKRNQYNIPYPYPPPRMDFIEDELLEAEIREV